MPTTHPDFAHILAIFASQDDNAARAVAAAKEKHESSSATMTTIFDGRVDYQSLKDASYNRALMIKASVNPAMFALAPEAAIAAVWTDAFLAGVQFQQDGGHIEPPTTTTQQ